MRRWSCILFVFVCVFADDVWVEVNITQGTVRGRRHSHEDLYVFYNIPYATAPEGEYKFKAPLPPPKWTKPYDAVDKYIVCPQNKLALKTLSKKMVMRENCLVANIFVPDTEEERLSVLVYVHGGGFVMGYGNINKATQFMRTRDFIMVTFNYRLGVHGFLCLGTNDIPGNAGMKDQVALLRWVQKNIASFGGNPNDVTLAGNSAGAAAVDLLMLSKSAEGLFHRVIPESGGNLAAFAVQRDPIDIAKRFAKELIFANIENIDVLEKFYKTATIDMLTADPFLNRTDSTFMFSPCVENHKTDDVPFLTESPLRILRIGNYKKLPMLYGFTSMEGLLRIDFFDIWKHNMNVKFADFLPPDLWFESDEQKEEVAQIVKKFYFGNKTVSSDTLFSYVNYFSDVMITYPMLRAVELHVKAGNHRVYLYQYNFLDMQYSKVPKTIFKGAEHCAQSTAWLDDVKNAKPPSFEYLVMRNTVREIWHSFIKTGKPIPKRSPLRPWPAVGADRSPHMSIGDQLELRGPLLERITNFWDEIYENHYLDALPPVDNRLQKNLNGQSWLNLSEYKNPVRHIKLYYRPAKPVE